MIQTRAAVTPVYLNASRDFGRWFSHNWRALEAYYAQLGGNKYDTAEYLAFCQCQFDRQQHSPRDEEHLHEVEDDNRRFAANDALA